MQAPKAPKSRRQHAAGPACGQAAGGPGIKAFSPRPLQDPALQGPKRCSSGLPEEHAHETQRRVLLATGC